MTVNVIDFRLYFDDIWLLCLLGCINQLSLSLLLLCVAGQWDLVCNHLGTEAMLQAMPWSGSPSFTERNGGIWTLNGSIPAGYVRASDDDRLTFLVVLGGSHMVPMDVPHAAFDMMERFIKKKSYFDTQQPVLKYHIPVVKHHGKKDNGGGVVLTSNEAVGNNVFGVVMLVCAFVSVFVIWFIFHAMMTKTTRTFGGDYHPYAAI